MLELFYIVSYKLASVRFALNEHACVWHSDLFWAAISASSQVIPIRNNSLLTDDADTILQ